MEALTIHDGLSQGMINCIYQDHFGFMWFGTLDGLNRYDGYHFTVYRYDANDQNSISGNWISSIFEDSRGRLWVGTALNGLNVFDRETEKFIRFQNDNKQPNTISGNGILSIQEDKFGSVWVGTSHGLNKISIREKIKNNDGSNDFNKRYHVLIDRIHFDASDSFNELFIYQDETGNNDYFEPAFFIDSKGFVWVSTLKALFRIKPCKDCNEQIENMDLSKLLPNTSSLTHLENHVFNFTEDTNSHALYLFSRNYITSVDQNSDAVQFFHCGRIDPAVSRTQIIINAGIIWESCSGSLYQFDVNNRKIWNIAPKNNDQLNMLSFANTIYKDRSGIIWIGTKGYGILKYNPRTEKFHAVNQSSIIWMSATPNNDIIIQSKKLTLYRYHDSIKEYVADTTFFKRVYEAVPQKTPDIAVQNKEGTCWINISSLVQFDPAKNSVKKFPYSACFPLFVDDHDNLWFGTKSAFCNLDKSSGLVKEYYYPLPKISMFPYQFLETICADENGVFWLGTINGLFRFDQKNQSWKRFVSIPNDNSTLSADVIFSICQDPLYPEKYLWIGTNGGGLNCFDKLTGKFIRYGEKDGLPNKVVYGILNDDSGNLWLSTNKGLSRFTPSYIKVSKEKFPKINGGAFKNFEEEDGLQSNEFNRYAFTRTNDGTLFFGGVNGFNYFDPKEINDNTAVPNVVVTDFKVNNKSVVFSHVESKQENTPLLSKPIFLTEKIVLPYKDNMITFEFSSMDFTAPEKNLFKYRLEGFDKEWIQSSSNHFATYTNLDPGKYTFHLAGSNNDGVWNEQGTSIDLTILPPWYMTWLFRVSLIAVLSAGLYAMWRYRLRQALKLMEVRNRIASDLHDEIGSTLSSVYIYSEVAQNSAREKLPEATMYMRQISVDVATMIDSLSDIVWTVNAKNDRFENIINRMRATAIELFEARDYELQLELDEQLNTLKLGMEARKNFYLFYKEAINNVAKYADGKNVFIRLGFEKRNIFLSVKDDGKGFDLNVKTHGNGLSNLKKRALDLKGKFEIRSSPGKGTEVSLLFPYS